MNGRTSKKVRQYYRRDLRKKLGLEVEIARRLVKPKPKWVPKHLWAIGARIYFNRELFDKWFDKK